MAGAEPVPPAPARVINMTPTRFFPEGVTVDRAGIFYVGSMDLGLIYKGTPDEPDRGTVHTGGLQRARLRAGHVRRRSVQHVLGLFV